MTPAPPKKREKIIVALHQMAISILLPRHRRTTFDYAGRPIAFSIKGKSFIRALDGTIKKKSWDGTTDGLDRSVTVMTKTWIRSMMKKIYVDLKKTREQIRHGTPTTLRIAPDIPYQGPPVVLDIMKSLLTWTPAVIRNDEKKFRNLYQAIPILPPDQYFSIVIQITEGCPWNKCRFCNFYRKKRYRVRPWNEIRTHIDNVSTFLGRGANLRQSVFLSDANAFAAPTALLLKTMEHVKRKFPFQTGPEAGIFSFADVPSILNKSQAELKTLREKGLRRLYLGAESGSDLVRRRINKPGSQKDLTQSVKHLKNAGINIGVIILLGAGGDTLRKSHIGETTRALRAMELGGEDIIYFSPLIAPPTLYHEKTDNSKSFTEFNKNKFRDEYNLIRKGLHFNAHNSPPKISIYDIREFAL